MASGEWYSTQTTAFVLLAIGKFIGESDLSGTLDFESTIAGKHQEVSTSAPMASLELPFEGDKGGEILFQNNSGSNLFVTIQLNGIPLDNKVEKEAEDLKMEVHYYDMDGKVIDPSRLEQGTDFMAEVRLTHPGIRDHYRELALTQMFPSGWEIRNLRMDQVESSRLKDRPEYQDIRDDRVYSYFGLKKNESKTFVVMLNAAYLGEYFLPAVYCEAMYDKTIHATEPGKWVRVIRQK